MNSAIKRVGVVRGGTGRNYRYSLERGGDIISHLTEHLGHKYKPVDILIDKNHIWHVNGVPVIPSDLVSKIDVAWNTTHPSFSHILKSLAIPHVSTPSFPEALQNSKELLREHAKNLGIPMPRSVVLSAYQEDFDGPREKYAMKKAKEIFEKFSSPWIVKSFTQDSNMAIHLAKTFPELVHSIEDGINHEKSILVEEFIAGKPASVHSVPNFRGEDVYTFPLGKLSSGFTHTELETLQKAARILHQHLGAKHYLKSELLLSNRGKVYLMGIESSPDLKKGSHFHEVCDLAGTKVHHMIEHMLEKVL